MVFIPLYLVPPSLYSVLFSLCSVLSSLYSVLSSLYSVQTLFGVFFTITGAKAIIFGANATIFGTSLFGAYFIILGGFFDTLYDRHQSLQGAIQFGASLGKNPECSLTIAAVFIANWRTFLQLNTGIALTCDRKLKILLIMLLRSSDL